MDDHITYEFGLPDEEIKVEDYNFSHLQKYNIYESQIIKAYNRVYTIKKLELIHKPNLYNYILINFGK